MLSPQRDPIVAAEEFEVRVERLTESLAQRSGISATGNVIAPMVRECLLRWQDVPVKDFIDILTERAVRARLRQRHDAAAAATA